MTPPINIDGSTVDAITIDGTEVTEVTADGEVVFGSATPDSAIHRYGFNEGSGSTATDGIGSNDGSLNGDAGYSVDAKEGSHSLTLDGNGDYVDLSAVSEVNISATTWFKPSSINTDFDNSNQLVCGGFNQIYHLNVDNNSKLRADIKVGSTVYSVTSTTTVNTGTYYFGGFGYDGSELRLYLDGSIEDTNSSMSGNLDSFSDGNSIGRRFNDTNSSLQFDGLIDDTILYDQGLAKSGFDQVYNSY